MGHSTLCSNRSYGGDRSNPLFCMRASSLKLVSCWYCVMLIFFQLFFSLHVYLFHFWSGAFLTENSNYSPELGHEHSCWRDAVHPHTCFWYWHCLPSVRIWSTLDLMLYTEWWYVGFVSSGSLVVSFISLEKATNNILFREGFSLCFDAFRLHRKMTHLLSLYFSLIWKTKSSSYLCSSCHFLEWGYRSWW